MPYLNRLIELKKDRKMTNAEIAKLSNLPLATITRVFNGHTPNPTFETFTQIAIALGASLDEIAGLKTPEPISIDKPIETTLSSYAELLKEKDERIKELKEEKEKERKDRHRLVCVLICFSVFIMAILTLDILNGSIGYIRY